MTLSSWQASTQKLHTILATFFLWLFSCNNRSRRRLQWANIFIEDWGWHVVLLLLLSQLALDCIERLCHVKWQAEVWYVWSSIYRLLFQTVWCFLPRCLRMCEVSWNLLRNPKTGLILPHPTFWMACRRGFRSLSCWCRRFDRLERAITRWNASYGE